MHIDENHNTIPILLLEIQLTGRCKRPNFMAGFCEELGFIERTLDRTGVNWNYRITDKGLKYLKTRKEVA